MGFHMPFPSDFPISSALPWLTLYTSNISPHHYFCLAYILVLSPLTCSCCLLSSFMASAFAYVKHKTKKNWSKKTHRRKNVWPFSFRYWIVLLSVTNCSNFLHLPTNIIILLFFIAEWYTTMYMGYMFYVFLPIHMLLNIWFDFIS